MKVLVTQSNYIPWKGYFDNINSSDVFVVYDDMQYTKRDWRNRNKILTPQGPKWLSVPVEVKGKYEQKINETSVADANWGKSHWGSIQQNYSKATYFKENQEWVKELYLRTDYNSITDINLAFIKAINAFLEITTRIMDSREFELRGDKTEKLANICVDLKASSYITGPAAKAYMSESVFTDVGIQIEYSDYSDYPEYEQLFTPFEHGVSILDLIFNLGIEAKSYMKSFK